MARLSGTLLRDTIVGSRLADDIRALAGGDVGIDVVTSAGAHFSITLADPFGTLSAANLSASDFIFA